MRKLGLVAGGGALPLILAAHCRGLGRPLFVIRLTGYADPALVAYDGLELGLGKLGAAFAALKGAGCEAVCFAGHVDRPNLKALQPDFRALAALPGAIAAAARGDDGLLTFLIREFEREGFVAEGADEVMAELLLPFGAIGKHRPARGHRGDIARALEAARSVGALDAGQGAVVCDGVILALEAREGTDAMLARIGTLPAAVRGSPSRRRGVLAKVCKPDQERRVDLPTIGPTTVRRAADAGLAGIVGEARGALVLEREQVAALADSLGLFVCGVEAPGLASA